MNFLQFLSTLGVAIISTFGLVQIKKVDRRNTEQHGAAVRQRTESELKLMGKLDGIHDDVQVTAHRVGQIDGKLSAHIADSHAHEAA